MDDYAFTPVGHERRGTADRETGVLDKNRFLSLAIAEEADQ